MLWGGQVEVGVCGVFFSFYAVRVCAGACVRVCVA